MVVLGFSSGLVVFSIVDGFLTFGFFGPGDVLGGTGSGAPGGGGVGCDGLWSSSLLQWISYLCPRTGIPLIPVHSQ